MPLSRQRGANSTEPEPNALTVCSWCWGAHAEYPYSATEAAAARKARKARRRAGQVEIAGQASPRFLPLRLTRGYRAKCVTPAVLPQASSAPPVAAAVRSPASRARRGGAAATRRRPRDTLPGSGHAPPQVGPRPSRALSPMPEMPVRLTAEDL